MFTLTKKAILSIFIILLPLSIAFVYTYRQNRDYLKEKILEEMTVIAEAYEGQVYQFLEMAKRRAQDFSSDGFIIDRLKEINNGKRDSVSLLNKHLLKNKLPLDKTLLRINIINPSGIVSASTINTEIGQDLSKEECFIKGKEGTVIAEYYTTKSGIPELIICSPVFDIDTKILIGVIENTIRLSELNKIMTGEFNKELGAISWSKGRLKTMETYIVNRDKFMLTESIFIKNGVLRLKVDTKAVNECLSSNNEITAFYKDYRDIEVAGASMCIPSLKWVVIAEIDESEVITPLNVMMKSALMGLFIAVGLIAVLFIIFLRNIVRPLGAIASATKDISSGNYDIEVPVKTSDEIGILSSSFNSMAKDIILRTKELRESEEKYRTLFEESKNVVLISTPDGRVIDINPAGVELLGYTSKEEIFKLNLPNDVYYDPQIRERFKQEIERYGFVKDFEVKLKKRDGQPIYALISANVVRNKGGSITAYRGIIHDLTAYKKLENQLFQIQKIDAIGKLTGGIAHDFNNFLTAIIGNTTLMRMKLDKNSELMTFIDQILLASEKSANLTRGLLTFSRKQIMDKKPVSLNDIIMSIERLIFRLIGEDIEIKVKLTGREPTIMADRGQIEQVIMNLATNARDAMPNVGVLSIITELTEIDEEFVRNHGIGKPGPYALILISDTGIGMDEETQKKIFEPFFTTKEAGKGTGLGLSIVYGIIKQHEGYINVYSELGKGTTFKIYLPVIESRVEMEKWEAAVSLKGGTETILLAEDDAEIRNLIKSILEGAGYKVVESVDGEDAANKFNEYKDKIGLLLFDVIMPKTNGKEAYEKIKKISPDIKVVFMSGYSKEIISQRVILEEELNFISKPIRPNELLRKVRNVLDG